jgi:hypothetical protein
MRIRQIALVARDLEPSAEALCDCLGIEVAFRDPGVGEFGLENVLMPIGQTFLEIVSPREDGTSAGRLLDRRSGDGGYMVILQTRDLQAERARLEALGIRIVWETELSDIATIHLHPKDVGGAILSLDEARPYESWRWAGPGWTEHAPTHRVATILGADIQSADPHAMAERWGAILGSAVKPVGTQRYEIELEEDGLLSFIAPQDARGDGLVGLSLRATNASAVLAAAEARNLPADDSSFHAAGVRITLVS